MVFLRGSVASLMPWSLYLIGGYRSRYCVISWMYPRVSLDFSVCSRLVSHWHFVVNSSEHLRYFYQTTNLMHTSFIL